MPGGVNPGKLVLRESQHAVGFAVNIVQRRIPIGIVGSQSSLFAYKPFLTSGSGSVFHHQRAADDAAGAGEGVVACQVEHAVCCIHGDGALSGDVAAVGVSRSRLVGKLYLERTSCQLGVTPVTVVVSPFLRIFLDDTAFDVFHLVVNTLIHHIGAACIDRDVTLDSGVCAQSESASVFHRDVHLGIGVVPVILREEDIVAVRNGTGTVLRVNAGQHHDAALDGEVAGFIVAEVGADAVHGPYGASPYVGDDAQRAVGGILQRAFPDAVTGLFVGHGGAAAAVDDEGIIRQGVDAETIGFDIGIGGVPIHGVAVHVQCAAVQPEGEVSLNLVGVRDDHCSTAAGQHIVGGVAVCPVQVGAAAAADCQQDVVVSLALNVQITRAVLAPFAHVGGRVGQLHVDFCTVINHVAR